MLHVIFKNSNSADLYESRLHFLLKIGIKVTIKYNIILFPNVY